MKRRRRRAKKCFFCGQSFQSKPQQKDKQYTCGNRRCKAARRRKAAQGWREENPQFQASHRVDDEYREQHRVWKEEYRKKNPSYVVRNWEFVKKSKRKKRLKGKSIVSRELKFSNDTQRL